MRILITGARAPTALDLARRCRAAGHTVFVGDSLRLGMAMFSRAAERSLLLPRPAWSPQSYADALCRLVDQHRIELIVPTCEEIFFLSRFRNQLPCRVLADEFEKLSTIHNKFSFSQIAGNEYAKTPQTTLITSREQLKPYSIAAENAATENWVFKPAYSRFASKTLIGPDIAKLAIISPSDSEPWVAQQRIRGQEFSTYGIARNGQLLAHACYRSIYRAGRGAGIYFVPVTDSRFENFVRSFVEQHQFSGQIGFDLMESSDGTLFAIEANPRTTSGLHLFAKSDPIVDIIVGKCDGFLVPSQQTPVMVEFAMPIWGLADAMRNLRIGQYVKDLLRARWSSFSLRDPLPSLALPASLVELAWIAIRERRSLIQASTFDIEWNGEPI